MPELEQFVMGAFALVGLVNIVQLGINKKWESFALAMVAVTAGSLFGYFQWFGLPSAEIGFLLGISSSGVYKVANRLGGVI